MGTPRMNPMNSLRTLLRMPSPTNVRSLSNAGLDRAQGLGAYEPSEQELKDIQLRTGGSVSRESLRTDVMQRIKQQLAEREAEQQREDDVAAQQEQTAFGKQRLVNEGQMGVARVGADSRLAAAEAAAEAKQQAINALLGQVGNNRAVSVSGVGGVGAPPRTGGGVAQMVPEGMDRRLQEARSRTKGFHPLDYLYSKMGGTPSSQQGYESALTSVLSRTGKMASVQALVKAAQESGISAADAIEQFEDAGLPLDPYEQEYLQLKLGQ